jgi:pyridoxine kinase
VTEPTELPLAKAVEKVVASMGEMLARTMEEVKEYDNAGEKEGEGAGLVGKGATRTLDEEREWKLGRTRAAEVRVVRYVREMRRPGMEGVRVVGMRELEKELAEGR